MSTATPVRLQRSRAKGARLVSPNGLRIVSCSRPGIFGNVFTGPGAAAAFRRYLIDDEAARGMKIGGGDVGMSFVPSYHHRRDLLDIIPRLKGFNLLCWCGLCAKHRETGKPLDQHCPDCKPCHVDVIAEVLYGVAAPRPALQGGGA